MVESQVKNFETMALQGKKKKKKDNLLLGILKAEPKTEVTEVSDLLGISFALALNI